MGEKYPYQNFYQLLEKNARKYGKKPAIFEDNLKITHSELKHYVDSFARYLELSAGIQKGDHVAILMQNSKEFIIALLAITKLGAVAIPVNTFLKKNEIEYILDHSDSKLLITQEKFQKELTDIFQNTKVQKIIWAGDYKNFDQKNLPFDEGLSMEDYEHIQPQGKLDDVAIMVYTSGTTGKPKGVMLTYKNIFSNLVNIEKLFKLTHKDRFIVYLPMFHTFTLTATVLLPLYVGSAIVVIKSILPFSNILKQTLLKRVTIFMGVPEVYNALSKAKLPWYFMWFNKLRVFVSGAAPLPEATLKRMREKFPKVPLLEGYGLSEASPVVSINRREKQKPLSVGPPLPDYQVKIVDDELMELPVGEIGEIIVKGDNVMKGYYKDPTATEETVINGWLLTGDMGYVDEEGYIYIVDRKKDLIISKGINIYPREIEEALMSHPEIEEAAVVGKKDETQGEIPVAFIKLTEGSNLTEKEIRNYLKDKLANYKIPKLFYFVEDMPRNATGKILKRVLREKVNKGEFD
ncbi:fatty acid--CoA ligase [Persephonella sp. KM09-Lau-8]|uniref:fatty acid--CoA ligase n=1 Tax=Persephonella sp. KM09-Lau-8 TaxID=1158345 RepID=UPI0004965248|nr:fatty acid--CoA ligase [Persephonella sp. KM09-Lau-8]